jgi:hypothetical protein
VKNPDREHEKMDRQRKNKAKIGVQEGVPFEWSRCRFIIPSKKRPCNMERVGKSDYCGNHGNKGRGVRYLPMVA